jgi:hypothetical protein
VSILLGFAFTLRFLEVDILINAMLMCWTYFYAISYFPFHGHVPVQTFQPFSTSGLNEWASSVMTISNDILLI